MSLLSLLVIIMTMKTAISIKKCSKKSRWYCNQFNNKLKTTKLPTLKIEMIVTVLIQLATLINKANFQTINMVSLNLHHQITSFQMSHQQIKPE
jgi:hypothetical protein